MIDRLGFPPKISSGIGNESEKIKDFTSGQFLTEKGQYARIVSIYSCAVMRILECKDY